ncbi:MAG: FadR/GntR family transcriptional regulator [Gammaproteobacteria bacterium]|nr:FadR/GntR family transcriptional regulator [Gammaproteobacteria bacterium]
MRSGHRIPGPWPAGADGGRHDARVVSASGIANRIRRAIIDGEFGYRERLPSERALADRFGAARGTVRSALKELEESNMVSRRTGSGTFVRYRGHVDREDVASLTSPLELIDVRCAVEPPIAKLAVLHANSQDLQRLSECMHELESADDDSEKFSRADEAFHLCLAESTRNPLMLWLYRHINDIRGHSQWSARKDKILTPARIREYNVQHRALYTAVASRDADAAERVMTQHLAKARSDLLGEGWTSRP